MTAMPVAEPMTAEEYLARPHDPAERGWELAPYHAMLESFQASGVWPSHAP